MTVGVDIEEIERFKDKPQRFLDKVYTKGEQEYCFSKPNPAGHLAVRFCAKEAVIKALNSMGIRQPAFNQIEVRHDLNKCPKISLPENEEYKNLVIELSLSHDKTKAIAFVVVDKK